jgi:hypothetical protein
VQIDRSFREATAGSLLQRQIRSGKSKKKTRSLASAGGQTLSVPWRVPRSRVCGLGSDRRAPASGSQARCCLGRPICSGSPAKLASPRLRRPRARLASYAGLVGIAVRIRAPGQTISVLQRHEAHRSVAQEREKKLSPADLC